MEEKTMSINVQPISDENKRRIIITAVELVKRNHRNFGNNSKKEISKSNVRNLMNATDKIPVEFTLFSYYLAAKNRNNRNLVNFIKDINNDINELTDTLELTMYKSLVIKEYMGAVVQASTYSEAFRDINADNAFGDIIKSKEKQKKQDQK